MQWITINYLHSLILHAEFVDIIEGAKWASALTSKFINFLVINQAAIQTHSSAYGQSHYIGGNN